LEESAIVAASHLRGPPVGQTQGKGKDENMSSPPTSLPARRKLIEFAPAIWQALALLSRDTGRSVQALAEEAFLDLLRKHQRPTSLKEALRESARRLPANDDMPPQRHGT
jgi:hypothetical protein